jgi:hypothetical protein
MVTNSFGSQCSQWEEGSPCTQSALIFFLLSFGFGAVGEDFFHFSFVPNMFP